MWVVVGEWRNDVNDFPFLNERLAWDANGFASGKEDWMVQKLLALLYCLFTLMGF
jgi:hypothetical protein